MNDLAISVTGFPPGSGHTSPLLVVQSLLGWYCFIRAGLGEKTLYQTVSTREFSSNDDNKHIDNVAYWCQLMRNFFLYNIL